ncbi:MAG: ArsC family [Thermoplasmata archaeon]|jgi:arsenate reductase-like glutaredoxin family protein|nr:ArsC family [Thermoplasmata archaeon]MEA3166191.1 ArsC family [Thermoplasmata archaeon]
MSSGVTFWGRVGHADTEDALRFLKQNHYAADKAFDLMRQPPKADDLDRLAKGLGGLWPLVDPKCPDLPRLLPKGEATPPEALRDILATTPGLLRSPILLTPKGAVAGFREQKWRVFLDIGKGRS